MVDLVDDGADASGLPPSVQGTFVTVGTFDGVHLGHQDVLGRLARRAREAGLRSLLVTFEPHPLEVLRPADAPRLLTLPHEKLEVLAEVGLDYVAVVPFTRALSALDAEAFVRRVLLARFRMRELLIGYDHRFGRGRSGDVGVLRELGARHGFGVEVVEPVRAGGERPVSSTMIRRAVAAGDLATAAAGLGRPYAVSGRVVPGEARGRTLGVRTINLEPPPARKLLPPEGVYAVRAQTPHGAYGGMMNLGPRPTFGDPRVSLEAHLFDVERDFYGAHVRLEFVARLRDTRRFSDAAALVAQLRVDEAEARRALTLVAESGNLYSSAIYDLS
ncbi:MAG TPA: bifunctional riboflavin kinase/FAD synthetase [Gemmatimonadaceae bacterium]|nr:bifunctional riboflavin kinase/FAD synthetase [Gemmatimonadaceae bacterium]